ncbi:unnamed protein product, partial [Notodromas monacha]
LLVGLVQGNLYHHWYHWLDKWYPGKDPRTVLKKILADEAIASPTFGVSFFLASGTLEMKPLLVSLREFAYKYPRVYLMDLCIWPPTMYLNFLFVPGQYRVLVVNCANILWTAFLSFVKHAQHEVGPTGLVFEELVPFGRERLFGEVDRLLAEGETWPVVSRSHGVVVRSRFSQEYRRSLYFAKAVMPAKPKQMLDVFWKDGLDIPKWNPTALAVEVVKVDFLDLDDQTRITWQSTKAQVAGLIGSRDFVNLNFWRSSGEGTIDIVYSNATWPGMNGASGMRFSPLPGGKECTMTWVFNANMDFSAFIPNGILTRVIPSSLIDYLGHLRKNVSR